MTRALRVGVVGAESTGKSTLALALAARIRDEFGLATICVPELLRDWCNARGRTPRRDEQAAIAWDQQRATDAAAASADVVICDTTPLMTAVYSRMLFDDGSIDDAARLSHAGLAFTLRTALDLPWVADPLQRDGPHVRVPVDALVRSRLMAWGGDWAVISGAGKDRTTHALEALRPVLARWSLGGDCPHALFSSLGAARVGPRQPAALVCKRCDENRGRNA